MDGPNNPTLNSKQIKEKTPDKGTREQKKSKYRSLNKRQHLKAYNAQWRALREEIK